ncbi:2-succinyl-6-hydroxy-2,4-cyclohexadiene-1-carboxylate synthase [Pseudanabaena sp. Chao 1811]|uniref:2-succinyl-6-hydroxy-2, 4-cyclohexadiene-1-carboxylate synthase n=1 Tax=Pseudanabaena sp. Chao 1811 TaxID=2963092 RepID=UPI0022F3FCE0|nr:2-succinyl-6-hydroxy-2,4-cyclohexadiene-1-carboxylate synthase [Pseudanabaena sp. Chao 1811]
MVRKVQIGNYGVTYYSEGDASNPAILFLHGFMGDRDEFKQAIAFLSKQFYCVAIDLFGHGQTCLIDHNYQDLDDIPQPEHYYTIHSSADLVINFLDFLRLDYCFLIGYSMGGRLALYLTIHFPQYFYKVVLESASAGLRTDAERSDRLAKDYQLATKLESGDFRQFLENWYQQPIFNSLRSHPDFQQLLEQRLKNSPSQLARSLRDLSTGMQPSLWEDLPKIKIPLLLLAGELDPKFVKINQQMEQLTEYSQLEIVPSCGHNIHFENPKLFVEKIQAFFQK